LWVSDVYYKYPLLKKNDKRILKFQHKWLTEYKWLCYSEVKNGAFCKYCVLFAKSDGVGSQIWGPFVTIPFTIWNMAKFQLF